MRSRSVLLTRGIAAMLASCFAATAPAAVVYESATPAGVPTTAGYMIAADNFLGVRFQLTQPTLITHIGGELTQFTNGGTFAALIALTDMSDYPDSTDLTTPDVLRTATFNLSRLSSDVSVPVAPITVPAGWYGILFGAGLFGTTGSGGVPNDNTIVGTPRFFRYTSTGGYEVIGLPGARFFVADAPVPEPTAALAGAVAVAWFIGRRRNAPVSPSRC